MPVVEEISGLKPKIHRFKKSYTFCVAYFSVMMRDREPGTGPKCCHISLLLDEYNMNHTYLLVSVSWPCESGADVFYFEMSAILLQGGVSTVFKAARQSKADN